MPTRFGLGYMAMTLALLVGSINHNNNLGYLLTFLLAGILLASLAHTHRNLRGIRISATPAPPVFAGQVVRFPLHFHADVPQRFGIEICQDTGGECIRIDPPGNSASMASLPMQTTRRGRLHIDSILLSTSYPLGLLTLEARHRVSLSGLVYPKPIFSPFVTEGSDDRSEKHRIRKDGGRDFSGLTQYRPGDSLHQIHWRSFAAGKGLHSKQFTEKGGGNALFSLEELPGQDLEIRLSQLCHMVLAADAMGMAYGLRLGKQVIPPGRGNAHRQTCLQALALV